MNMIESGWYHDPAHSGSGFVIENTVGTGGVFAGAVGTWYTFNAKKEPMWLFLTPANASGYNLVVNRITSSTPLQAGAIEVTPCGEMTLTPLDDGGVHVEYAVDYNVVHDNEPSPAPPDGRIHGSMNLIKTLERVYFQSTP